MYVKWTIRSFQNKNKSRDHIFLWIIFRSRNRSSLPSPMRTRAALTPHTNNFAKRRSCSRFQSLTDIDRPGGTGNGNANQGISKERKKFVTFTVDMLSEGEPLGMTLASDTSAETPGPIYISAVTLGKV